MVGVGGPSESERGNDQTEVASVGKASRASSSNQEGVPPYGDRKAAACDHMRRWPTKLEHPAK